MRDRHSKFEVVMNAQTVFFAVFGLVVAIILFKVIKHGGWKGAMFGAPVRTENCVIELAPRGCGKTKLKVHVLDPQDRSEGPHVGIEVIQSTIGSWEMRPVSLSRAEARTLAEELLRAASESETGSPPDAG
jgi:hypothetical protein